MLCVIERNNHDTVLLKHTFQPHVCVGELWSKIFACVTKSQNRRLRAKNKLRLDLYTGKQHTAQAAEWAHRTNLHQGEGGNLQQGGKSSSQERGHEQGEAFKCISCSLHTEMLCSTEAAAVPRGVLNENPHGLVTKVSDLTESECPGRFCPVILPVSLHTSRQISDCQVAAANLNPVKHTLTNLRPCPTEHDTH